MDFDEFWAKIKNAGITAIMFILGIAFLSGIINMEPTEMAAKVFDTMCNILPH